MSQSPTSLFLYCKITIGNTWLDGCISIHFILKIEVREDLNKCACQLLSDSEPVVPMAMNFGCTPTRTIESLALVHGVTMVGFCLINEHWRGHWLCGKSLSKLIHWNVYCHVVTLVTMLVYERYRQWTYLTFHTFSV